MKVSNRLRVVAERRKKRKEDEEHLLQELEEQIMQRMKNVFLFLLFGSSVVLGFASAIVYESVVGQFWFNFSIIGILIAWMIFIFALWPGKWLTLWRAKYAFRMRSYLRALKEDIVYLCKFPLRYLTARG